MGVPKGAAKTAAQRTTRRIPSSVHDEALRLTSGHGGEEICVVLKYFDIDHECLSAWQHQELKQLSKFIQELGRKKWSEVEKTGGKRGRKTGFGYTVHKDPSKLPRSGAADYFSEDITWIELRVSGKARVHGFRFAHFFFLMWLDRNHEVHAT